MDTKVDNEYEERIAREAKIAEIAAAKKAAQKWTSESGHFSTNGILQKTWH